LLADLFSMTNYDYCVEFVASRLPSTNAKVLDFGCGNGKIVSQLRERGIDASGCDVFYEGGDASKGVPPEMFGNIIRKMEGNLIPFEANTFDWIISNQVLEHVPDLDAVLEEMRRVLKPDGFVLSMFPDRGVWREGHCGIPFLHRFPRESGFRVWYAAALRGIGFGYHTKGQSALAWSENFCHWLDNWTHYRPYRVIRTKFLQQFTSLEHMEDDWFHQRLGPRAGIASAIPKWAQRLFVRKMVGLVIVTTNNPRQSAARTNPPAKITAIQASKK
jgi:SAM-dependent methyltransferase